MDENLLYCKMKSCPFFWVMRSFYCYQSQVLEFIGGHKNGMLRQAWLESRFCSRMGKGGKGWKLISFFSFFLWNVLIRP